MNECWTFEVHFITGKTLTFTALVDQRKFDQIIYCASKQNDGSVAVTTTEDTVISLAGSQIMLIKAWEVLDYEP